jgi:AcrR family transcriptional regulator
MTIDQPGAKLTRAEKRELSRTLILSAAIRLFAERGFDGVTLDEIVTASSANRSLIIYYFKSKEELWRVCAEEVAEKFNTLVRVKLEKQAENPQTDSVRSTLECWLDAFLEEPNLAKFLVREGGVGGPRLQWLVEHYEYASLSQYSPALVRALSETIMRDALMAIFLSMAALGPLMEASLSHVSGQPSPGVYPMSSKNRLTLVNLLMRFLTAADAVGDAEAAG